MSEPATPTAAPLVALIAAAGIGSRMSSPAVTSTPIPKQYLPLQGRSVISRSIATLAGVASVERVIVVLHPQDSLWQDIEPDVKTAGVKVETVTGADTRASSVAAGLRYILALIESAELAANTRVLVHDAARPLVRRKTIERLVTEVDKVHACGGLLAIPATDTLKVANADVTVAQTLDRSLIWQAQTPQLFDVRVLHDAIQSAMDNGMPVTDEASAMEFAGYTPLLVEGDKDNIKLTHSLDLSLAEILLQAQETE